MLGKIECFNCGTKTSKKKSFTVIVNTSEGKHKLPLCNECGIQFSTLSLELEEILNERPKPV